MPGSDKVFPSDVLERARKYLNSISGGLGSYTHSQGLEVVREEIAEFIAVSVCFAASSPFILNLNQYLSHFVGA